MTALKVDVLQKGIAINIDTKIIEQHSQEEIA